VRTSRKGIWLTAVALVVGLGLIAGILTNAYVRSMTPPPVAVPTWHPVEAAPVLPSAAPEEDVEYKAAIPLRVQVPSVDFDSEAVVPKKATNVITEWTKAMNDAYNGVVQIFGPWDSALVWDSTVKGGGLIGTDVETNGRIIGHTAPWGARDQKTGDPILGVFNPLHGVKEGDIVAITTKAGTLCYNVKKKDTDTPKDKLNVVYPKDEVHPGIVYLITCYRPEDWPDEYATVNQLVLTLELNQQSTNAGTCW